MGVKRNPKGVSQAFLDERERRREYFKKMGEGEPCHSCDDGRRRPCDGCGLEGHVDGNDRCQGELPSLTWMAATWLGDFKGGYYCDGCGEPPR